jgi:hypothetical protein
MTEGTERRRATMPGVRVGTAALLAAAVQTGASARAAAAQGSTTVLGGRPSDWAFAAVGSEEENYMRVLQVAGIARPRPWSLRPFGPSELGALLPDSARHPWRARARFGDRRRAAALASLGPGAALAYNSGFPFSVNDGAVWAGRGVTAIATGGFAARWWWLSMRLEPVAFWAANRPFALARNGAAGLTRFGDPLEAAFVDLPQRFGDRPYGRVDWGQSTVRMDALGLAVGATTANGWTGPALTDPLVLGNTAGGYPRLFAGTARPLRTPVGTVHVRVDAGRIDQSRYAASPSDSARRLATSVTAVVTARGLPGLEIGGTRFFHQPWNGWGRLGPGLSAATATFFRSGDRDPVPQNQLSSVFARFVVPSAGTEVWGEFMRNDAAADPRDFWVEPDHNSGWNVGARRVWRRPTGALVAGRFETMNTLVTHLARVRTQTRAYQHGQIRQGHTARGEALGTFSGMGGLATVIGMDAYQPDGRWTFEYARRVRQSTLVEGAAREGWDVYHVLRAERLRDGGAFGDLFVGASGVAELNRDFAGDAYQLRFDVGWRFGGRRVR